MYVVTPFPNILSAFPLKNGGQRSGNMSRSQPHREGVACCDTVKRGSSGKIPFKTLEDHAVCVDPATGKVVQAAIPRSTRN